MSKHLRAQHLARLSGWLAEVNAAHEQSLTLSERAMELDRAVELEAAQYGFEFDEIDAEAGRRVGL